MLLDIFIMCRSYLSIKSNLVSSILTTVCWGFSFLFEIYNYKKMVKEIIINDYSLLNKTFFDELIVFKIMTDLYIFLFSRHPIGQEGMTCSARLSFPLCTKGVEGGRVQNMEIFCLPKGANPRFFFVYFPLVILKDTS